MQKGFRKETGPVVSGAGKEHLPGAGTIAHRLGVVNDAAHFVGEVSVPTPYNDGTLPSDQMFRSSFDLAA